MNIKKFILTGIILFLTDMGFIYLITPVFNTMVKKIQGRDISIKTYSFILAYIFLTFQIYYFIIEKNLSLLDAFLLGMTTYGIFDLTNLTIFKNYSFKVSLIDTTWGGILYLLVTLIYRYSEKLLNF